MLRPIYDTSSEVSNKHNKTVRAQNKCSQTLYVKKESPMYAKMKFSARKFKSWKNFRVCDFDSSDKLGYV